MDVKGIFAIIVGVVIITAMIPIFDFDTDNSNDLAVVVIAGQSNGAYWATAGLDAVNAMGIPDTNVLYYGTPLQPTFIDDPADVYDGFMDNLKIYSMLNNNRLGWKISSYEACIAYGLSERFGVSVLTINVALPSTDVEFWTPGHTGAVYAKALIDDAIDKIPDKYRVIRTGFVWIQGEQDYNTSIDSYISSFDKVLGFYEGLGFDTGYIVQTRPYNAEKPAEAQMIITETHDNVIMGSTLPSTFTVDNGMLQEDNLHYTSAGRHAIGLELGDVIDVDTTSPLESLVGFIPLIVVAGLVIAVVGTVFYRYRNL